MLLRDADNPERFVSFGTLGEHAGGQNLARASWLSGTGGGGSEVLDSFEPRTLELVAGG